MNTTLKLRCCKCDVEWSIGKAPDILERKKILYLLIHWRKMEGQVALYDTLQFLQHLVYKMFEN
jgi:hypothetical protein